jgi:radical SAM protein with 4Fe4S-binding SPASM domain
MNRAVPYSKLNTGPRKLLRDIVPLRMPLSLWIEPTNHCNYRCVFCARSRPDFQDYAGTCANMDIALFEKICLDIKQMGKLASVKLYNFGEPFLHPAFGEILQKAICHDIAERIEITTNASVMDCIASAGLVAAAADYRGIIYVRISVSSVQEERHARLTLSDIPVSRIAENVAALRKIRDQCGRSNVFVYVKMIDSGSRENGLFADAFRACADECSIEEPMNFNGFQDMDLIGTLSPGTPTVQRHTNRRTACPYPFYSLAINADGSVVACCVDWNRGTVVGNIGKESLEDIWRGEKLFNLRKAHVEGRRREISSCKNCDVLYRCPESDTVDGIYLKKPGAVV